MLWEALESAMGLCKGIICWVELLFYRDPRFMEFILAVIAAEFVPVIVVFWVAAV